MKFTRFALAWPLLAVGLAGCAETETTISVNVRYWTDYVDSTSLAVKIEKSGQSPIEDTVTPRFQGKVDKEIDVDGQKQIVQVDKYDVVCDHNWELAYCRFFKRFPVSWSAGEVTVTLSGKAVDGTTLADAVMASGDKVVSTFDLEEHEINVVYFQLSNTKTPSPPPEETGGSDSSGDTSATAASSEAVGSSAAESGDATSAASAGDESGSSAGADTAAADSTANP